MFGFTCECTKGKVKETTLKNFPTKIDGKPIIVPEAKVGVCNSCGAKYFNPKETKRWRTLV